MEHAILAVISTGLANRKPPWPTCCSALATAVGGIITVVTAAIAVFKAIAVVIAAIVSPVGLAITAVAALGAYIVYATGVAGKAIAWLGSKFAVLKDDALGAYQGIADAMAAGDIALAAKILWLTIKMEWTRGIGSLEKSWLDFRTTFIRIGYDAWHGLAAVAETTWHALEVGWIETTAFFAKTWASFIGFFAKTWEEIKAGASKAWNWIKSLFDDSIDLKAENRLVEKQKQAAISQIDDKQQRQIAQREAKRQADRQRASAVHDGTLAQIGQENLDAHEAIDVEYASKMAQNEAELTTARQEWQDALAEAKAKRKASPKGPGKLEGPDAIIAKAQEALAGLGGVGGVGGAIEVQSSFNAVAAGRGLSSGGPVDKIGQRVVEIDRNIARLVQEAKKGGQQFA